MGNEASLLKIRVKGMLHKGGVSVQRSANTLNSNSYSKMADLWFLDWFD